jgi:Putative metallopeptidase
MEEWHMRLMPLLSVLACSALCSHAAFSAFCLDPAFDGSLKSNQVRYLYVEPTNAAHRPIYDRLRERRVLEQLSEFLSPLRLPRILTLKVQGCDGRVNSYYWEDNVTVCYEYLDSLVKAAPVETTSEGLTRHDALVGMTVDVFLHETGHAVFDLLQIPFLGREEDAADQFSTYIQLQLAKEDARRLILGVAFLGQQQAEQELARSPQGREFADMHGTPAQRYFNVLCMAYGSDPELFANAVSQGHLPQARAKNCDYEYSRFGFGFDELIAPYLDKNLVEQVKARKWFHFETPQ